jgi:hypothetical protein
MEGTPVYTIIGTWKMSLEGVHQGCGLLAGGGTAGDAVTRAITCVEDNPAFVSVGCGGLPDRDGHVMLDAGYMDGRYIASFCGFAPVEDPRVTVLVIIDDPTLGSYYGGQIAAPVAGRIFAQLMRYLHIEPTSDTMLDIEAVQHAQERPKPKKVYQGEVPNGKVVMPDFIGISLREAARKAADSGLKFVGEGSGVAVQQSIEPNTLVDQGTEITVYFAP